MMRRLAIATVIMLAACDRPESSVPGNSTSVSSNSTIAQQTSTGPSFDCTRAKGQAHELICSDPDLAAMDRELARLYALAAADPQLNADEQASLGLSQRGWEKGRDECWKADELRQCVETSYVQRIHQIRQGSQAARAHSEASRSVGPVAYLCAGIDAAIGATFVNTDPGNVYLEWADRSLTLASAPSGSGAKYEGRWDGQSWTFWIKGDEATFTVPGKGDLSCREQETG
jgi:uncharacterized protein